MLKPSGTLGVFGLNGLYKFINENAYQGDSLLIGKFKLLTDNEIDQIMELVNNTDGRTFIYCTVSQETAQTKDLRLQALKRLKQLKPSKIVIVDPFANDLTVMGAKKYVSYIPDIILRIYNKYPSADIKALQCELSQYNVNNMLSDAIKKYKQTLNDYTGKQKQLKIKTIKTMETVTVLTANTGVSDQFIQQMVSQDIQSLTTKIDLSDLYPEYKKLYITEAITFRDLNKQYVRDDFVFFTLMRNNSKALYKNINVISANFDFNENDEDDYTIVDLAFNVPKNDPFCQVQVLKLNEQPEVIITPLRDMNLDDSALANDLKQFLEIVAGESVEFSEKI